MKKILFMLIMVAAVAACQKKNAVTAEIDQNGDCIFQNSVVCFRLPGAGNPVVTDGVEAILKTMDKKEVILKDRKSALAASMNDGGSALLVNDSLVFPHENFDSFEIVEQTPTHVIFTLHYPKWVAGEDSVSLTRTITLREPAYTFKVKDVYDIRNGQDITVATGLAKRGVEKYESGEDYIAAWESVASEGNIGVGFVMPMTRDFLFEGPQDHAIAIFKTKSGRPVEYAMGSCWSNGVISSFDHWLEQFRP